ncbi:hypothetical protein [Actinoplanes sp. NPDC049316]
MRAVETASPRTSGAAPERVEPAAETEARQRLVAAVSVAAAS